MKYVEVICSHCQLPFNFKQSEVNRHIKKGWKNKFCSKLCNQNYNKLHSEDTIRHLQQTWVGSDANKEQIKLANKMRWQKDEDHIFAEFLRRIRKCSKYKNKQSSLTIPQLKKIWEKQRGICPYTGWKLEIPRYNVQKKINTASLDRIDSDKWYSVDNIQFVSVMANFAKNNFPESDMQKFCIAICKNYSKNILDPS